jgi:hypothetical protein
VKKFYIVCIISSLIALTVSVFFWMRYSDMMFALKHDANRWAVITDREGSLMAVEPASNAVWRQLTELYQNKSARWVGGIVEMYENKWGFRFKPENVTVAEFTAEGLQATIRYISENMDYWLGGWAYVSARVIEAHSP